jgi:two-component system, NtrC family, sensor kinase
MSAVNSKILMIGNWNPQFAHEWGADSVDLLSQVEDRKYDVVLLSVTHMLEKDFGLSYLAWKKKNPFLQIIAECPHDLPFESVHFLNQTYPIRRFLDSKNDPRLEEALLECTSEVQLLQQREVLSHLQQEEAEKLTSLQNELENRVEKRARYLTEIRRKLFVTYERVEAFQKLLMQLPSARSSTDLEKLLTESLSRVFDLQWIKIILKPEDDVFSHEIRKQLDYQIHRLFLYDGPEKMGSLFLMGSQPHAFTKDETDYLLQIAESVSLALDAIKELESLTAIRHQWEKTFESLSDPLLLIDRDYNVVQSNQKIESGIKPKCYEVLFKRSTSCPGCKLGEVFQVQLDNSVWEVRGQKIETSPNTVYAHFYRDITESIELQRRWLETSRLIEMGTVSSSLAHELNNPLAGLLTFAQMLKGDLKVDDPLYPDIVEIEKGILKCRDIVLNLLVYARDPSLDPETEVDLVELMHKFIKILEVPTRTKGLKIRSLLSDKPIIYKTKPSWLLSVWKTLGLWAVQALEKARAQDPHIRNEILVSLSESAKEIQWNLEVDADLIEDQTPASFKKILEELHGHLQFERVQKPEGRADSPANGRGLRAKISFPRDSRPARKP